jgi:regulator of cell morphogenesis and NO signaling
MMTNTPSLNTVRELAVAIPGATRVFEQFGIDYCCGGHRPLSDACEARNIEVEEVVGSLEASWHAPDDSRYWRQPPLASLAAYIIDKHHYFAKE